MRMTIDEIRDRVIALEKRADREEERHAYLEKRVEILEKTQGAVQDIRLMIERLTMGTENTKRSFDDLNARLDKLDKRLADRINEIDRRLDGHLTEPGEKWEKAKWAVFALVLGGVVTYLMTKILT